MTPETILFSVSNGVARLTLNRPQALNALNIKMHEEIAAVLTEVERARHVRVLLITGEGRAFCAGQDLTERRFGPDDPPIDLGESLERRYNPLILRLATLDRPVVCAVNGVAAGAGANLALACDIVIAKASATFVQSFVNLGLAPDSGGTWSLPRLVGQARALGLAMIGEPLSAELAADWGLIWRAAPDAAFEAEVEALINRFACAPTCSVAATKAAIRGAFGHSLKAQLDVESDVQRDLGRTSDYREGVLAFRAKRPPAFTGA